MQHSDHLVATTQTAVLCLGGWVPGTVLLHRHTWAICPCSILGCQTPKALTHTRQVYTLVFAP